MYVIIYVINVNRWLNCFLILEIYFFPQRLLSNTVKPRDHCHIMQNHCLSVYHYFCACAAGAAIHTKSTCRQRPPGFRDHIFMPRFYCTLFFMLSAMPCKYTDMQTDYWIYPYNVEIRILHKLCCHANGVITELSTNQFHFISGSKKQ